MEPDRCTRTWYPQPRSYRSNVETRCPARGFGKTHFPERAETQPSPLTHSSVPTAFRKECWASPFRGCSALDSDVGEARAGRSGAAGSAGCRWAVGITGRESLAVEPQAECVRVFIPEALLSVWFVTKCQLNKKPVTSGCEGRPRTHQQEQQARPRP